MDTSHPLKGQHILSTKQFDRKLTEVYIFIKITFNF